jgi:hypothetical protein
MICLGGGKVRLKILQTINLSILKINLYFQLSSLKRKRFPLNE